MKNILVVENDLSLRSLISQLLRLEGFGVSVVENGRMALDALASGCHDLVLCDLLMPEMNGLELLGIMKDDRQMASVPLVFLTASAAPSDRERCLELGAAAFMTKPFHQEDLLTTLREVLEAEGPLL